MDGRQKLDIALGHHRPAALARHPGGRPVAHGPRQVRPGHQQIQILKDQVLFRWPHGHLQANFIRKLAKRT